MTTSPPSLPISDPSTTTSSYPSEHFRTTERYPDAPREGDSYEAPPVDITPRDTPQGQRDGSIDGIDGVGAKKRRKRPGWKGWALVVEDEQGNVLEYRPRGESPEHGNEASREGSAVVDNTARKAKSMSPFIGARHAGTSASPLVRSQALEKSTSSDGQKKRRRGSSAAREGPSTKSPRVPPLPLESAQASPSTAAAPTPPSAIPPRIISGEHPKPSASRSRVRTTSPSRIGTSQAREDARVAREARTEARSRVSTPVTAVVLPDDTPLPRVPRVGMGEEYPRPPESDVRAEGQYLIEAANRKREEQLLREEERVRDEDRQRQISGQRAEDPTYRTPEHMDLGSRPYPRDDLEMDRPAVSGWPVRPDEANGDPRAPPRRFWKGQNGSSNHHHPQEPAYHRSTPGASSTSALPVFYQTSNGQPSRSRYSAAFDAPHQHTPPPIYAPHRQTDALQDDFDAQYSAIQEDFSRRASTSSVVPPPEVPLAFAQENALGRGSEDVKPPKFHMGQRPTVVLAPAALSGRRPRDRTEREHGEGFDGLTSDVMADCDGFVDNVRENLRSIVTYFLPQPSARRDAFLERVGRGLVELGWQLTDTGDGALQRQGQDQQRAEPHPPSGE